MQKNARPPQRRGERGQDPSRRPQAYDSRQTDSGTSYGTRPQNGQMYGGQTRRRPMTEREYQSYRQRQRETAMSRQRQRDMERMMQKQQKRRRRQASRQVFLGRLAVFGVVFGILLILSLGLFWIVFNRTPDAVEEKSITYSYGGEKIRTVPLETAYNNGIWYFCFHDLADYLDMTQTGSAAERRFLFTEDTTVDDSRGSGREEYVCFPDGDTAAIVNGQRIPLHGANRLIGEEVWVSVDFVTDVMDNLDLQIDGDRMLLAKVLDTQAMEEAEDRKLLLYLDPAFRLKDVQPLEPVREEEAFLPNMSDDDGEIDMELANVTFVNDLTIYEQYMAPANRDEFLLLVNPENPLTAAYAPTDLMDVQATAQGRSTQQLRQYAAQALEALLLEMKTAGYTSMQVNSGYRTYNYQAVLFETYTNNELTQNPTLTREEAEKIVLTYSTRAGTSEHQTGLAVDMATDASFSTDFQYSEEYAWLLENAWKFGFILRFPADKVNITTIQFEPWHWRFVGRYHAKKIKDAGVCLEEYMERISQTEVTE